MKTRNILISLAALLTLPSCVRDIDDKGMEGGESTVTLIVGASHARTRSSVGSTDAELEAFENKIADLTLFRFLVDGSTETYESAEYFDLSSGSGSTRKVTVTGESGKTYKFYALLNCGDQSGFNLKDNDLTDLILDDVTISTMQSGGIPMVNRDGVSITFGTTTSADVPMTRLAARWDFTLDTSGLSHTAFSVSSLKLCQALTRLFPFDKSYAYNSSYVQDGDELSSDDITLVNGGGTVTFYVPENMCGELLSSNTDPWKKVPSSGTGVGGRYPTYIEMTGVLEDNSGEMSRESYYRMYLGENTTTNFDVQRGTQYTLTFKPTEDPITDDIRDEWKCELQGGADDRNFSFASPTYLVFPGGTTAFSTVNEKSEYGITYRTGFSGVSVNASAKTITNSSAFMGSHGSLYAYYWDGTQADVCTIYVGNQNAQPIGLYITNNDTSVTGSDNISYIHDPDCPANHYFHDYAQCTYNHNYHVPGSWMDPIDCPYTTYDDSDCQNRIIATTDAVVGESCLTAQLVTDFYVDYQGNLCHSTTISSGVAVTKVQLGTLADPDYWGTKSSTDTGNGSITINNGLSGGAVQWAAQFQDPKCQYWTVDVSYNGTTYTYVLPINATGLVNSLDSEPSLTFSGASEINHCAATGYTGDPGETFYIFSNAVNFFNLTAAASNPSLADNSFESGDELLFSCNSGWGGDADLYVLNSAGGIVRHTTFEISEYNVKGFFTSSAGTIEFYCYTGLPEITLPFTLKGIVGSYTQGSRTLQFDTNDCTVTTNGDAVCITCPKLEGATLVTAAIAGELADISNSTVIFEYDASSGTFEKQ